MTAPVVRQFTGTIPDKGQSQTAFDTNVDAFLDWQALEFAPDLVAFGTFASNTAAALVAANLPSLTGRELDAVRVNAAADGVEFANVTAAGWALLDDANAAAQRVTLGLVIGTNVSAPVTGLTQVQSENPTSTVFGTVSGQRLAQAIDAVRLTQVQAENAASVIFGTVSGQRLAQAVSDNLNAAGPAPLFACRAWVNFRGTNTVTIRASGNVSSVTDNGTGAYTVNFTTNMEDVNYSVAGSAEWIDTNNLCSFATANEGRLIGSVKVITGLSFGSPGDALGVSVAIFR